MEPTDFDCFAYGFNLTSAAYSGGAGGTFANLVSGQQSWGVVSATPTFETRNGMEGMMFANSANESILGEMRVLYEGTVLVICQPTVLTSVHAVGGNDAASNRWSIQFNSNQVQCVGAGAITGSGFRAYSAGRPRVYTASWSPVEGKNYIQVDDGSPLSQSAVTPKYNVRIDYPNGAIGRMRTTYFTGWIGRVLFFSRALHYSDNANLQLLIDSEMARVGL